MKITPIIFEYPKGAPRYDLRNSLEGIRNNSIDIMAVPTQATEKRMLNFSFSKTLYEVKGGFLIHQTENVYNNLWSFISVFDPWVWLAILLILSIQYAVCVLIRKMETVLYNAPQSDLLEVCNGNKFVRIVLQKFARFQKTSRAKNEILKH
jgi:hypothetical protein